MKTVLIIDDSGDIREVLQAVLESAGFRLIETQNRTPDLLRNASGRLAAMQRHRTELEQMSSAAEVQNQREYLETVVELARLGAISRVMYLLTAA